MSEIFSSRRATAPGKLFFLLALSSALAGAFAPAASAHPPRSGLAQALTGVKIVIAPGQTVESGTVVVRDGLIQAVGADVPMPPDAFVREHPGATVYAGFIEPYLERAWPEEVVPPQGGHANGEVRADRRMALHAADEASARRLRKLGFTTALVAPGSGVLRGRGALVALGDGDAGSQLIDADGPHFIALKRAEKGYPRSLMGVIALLRQTLLDADWNRRARAAYARSPAQPRPPFDRALEALEGAVSGTDTVVFVTQGPDDSLRSARLVKEFGLDAMLLGNGREYQRLAEIRATGLPHLLPLAFPKPPEVGKKGDALRVSLADLRHWDEAPGNPAALAAAGLPLAFTSHGLERPDDLFAKVAEAMEHGLSQEAALAALTTGPARLLGVEGRLGTVEAGKIANLIVVEGHLWVKDPQILEVWIDGRRYEIDRPEPPSEDPRGTWELALAPEGGEASSQATLRLVGEQGALEGSLRFAESVLDLSAARLSGKTLTLGYDGAGVGFPGAVELELEIDGDSLSGSGRGPAGELSVEGRRVLDLDKTLNEENLDPEGRS